MDQKIIKRFLSKVQLESFTRPHMTTPCLIWTASCDTAGYGWFFMQGRPHRAHRLAFCLAHNTSPDELQGLLVLHHCDNPPCVRPSHLYAGTGQDNVNDRVRRGRSCHLKGALHGCALLTEADVLAIRAAAGSMTYRALGKKFGVSQSHIGRLIRRKRWAHLL